MKKLLLIAATATVLSGMSALGEGYFIFSGPVRGNWDLWSTGTAHTSTNNRLAFLWASSGTPLVDGIAPYTPTNNATFFNFSSAWTAILNDPNFRLATNNTDGSLVVTQSVANGAWLYSWQTFPVAGTAVAAYQVFVIGWGGGYADPFSAAAAAAPVGWSNPFTYTAVSAIGTPFTMAMSGLTPFGVGIPEPGVVSLLGLGAVAFLLQGKKKGELQTLHRHRRSRASRHVRRRVRRTTSANLKGEL